MPHVPPDFLSTLLALARFMRLSLLKAAHAVLRWSHVQEIRVASAYVGRIRRAKPTRAFAIRSAKSSRNISFWPRYPDFLHGSPPTAACAAFSKESRMKRANASKVDRKSGVRRGEPGAPVPFNRALSRFDLYCIRNG